MGFAGALALGVDAIELDLLQSLDGAAVVTHDHRLHPDLARDRSGRWIAAPGPLVSQLSRRELAQFDVGRTRPGSPTARAHPRQRASDGAAIPLLEQVVELVVGTGVRLDVELKTDPAEPPPSLLVETVLATLARHDRVAIRSFDWRALALVRAHAPGMPLGFLSEFPSEPDLHQVLRVSRSQDEWAPGHLGLSERLVTACHAAGLAVKPWTVNDPDQMLRLIDMGVDGFCTDDPDLAHPVLRAARLAVPPPVMMHWPEGDLPPLGRASSLPP